MSCGDEEPAPSIAQNLATTIGGTESQGFVSQRAGGFSFYTLWLKYATPRQTQKQTTTRRQSLSFVFS